ncbi:MAG: hypothetical protein HGB15_09650 [Chlorobaculum sp.]|nr:hypothetical protein [Chlorobaculum sp.]
MRRFQLSIPIALIVLLPLVCRAEMIVKNYTPASNYRFYVGKDKDFVGDHYDFSGVGYGSAGHWATLVSNDCFLSALHLHPSVGEKITFWTSNLLTGLSHTYTVAGGERIGTTDLWLGWFDTEVDASIARYPVPMFRSAKAYLGLELLNYGMTHRVGHNVLDGLDISQLGGSTGKIAIYGYNPYSVTGNETFLQVGDSGAPSFAVFNSRLVLIGIHWSITHNPDSSIDTFVPEYFDEINKVLKKRGQALRRSRWRNRTQH